MGVILGILIPFLGTTIGSILVFFMKNTLNKSLEKILMGLASGVMIAASIWSLLIPSIEMAKNQEKFICFPSVIGFLLGIMLLLIFDKMISRFGKKLELNKSNKMLFLAVTLHNIPEGMAVGVAFAGVIIGNIGITMTGALVLALGIAIQNLPEGAIISMPLKASGLSKRNSFLYGFFSGIVEPIFALITLAFTSKIILILPYLLAFAAGSMMYVVVEELIPNFKKDDSKIGIIGLTIGFLIMMILDISLG